MWLIIFEWFSNLGGSCLWEWKESLQWRSGCCWIVLFKEWGSSDELHLISVQKNLMYTIKECFIFICFSDREEFNTDNIIEKHKQKNLAFWLKYGEYSQWRAHLCPRAPQLEPLWLVTMVICQGKRERGMTPWGTCTERNRMTDWAGMNRLRRWDGKADTMHLWRRQHRDSDVQRLHNRHRTNKYLVSSVGSSITQC